MTGTMTNAGNERAFPATPRVSIGLPVYNGEAYLDEALRSLTAQDFSDFEIIICDNASTDRTASIAKRWADRDPRIRYFRSDSNIGANPNFNRAFERARGRYFRWAAADDAVNPEYLRRCLTALEANPGAVLCQSLVQIIDGTGCEIGIYDGGVRGAELDDAADRFAASVLSRHLCTHVFGLVRSDALRATRLLPDYYGSDRALLAELALLGRFVLVPAALFKNREHPGRGSRAMRSRSKGRGPPIWNLYVDYWRAITSHVHDPRDGMRCRLHLLRWWLVDWNYARLAVELVGSIWPPLFGWVNRLKVLIYGPLPQLRTNQIPKLGARNLSLTESSTVIRNDKDHSFLDCSLPVGVAKVAERIKPTPAESHDTSVVLAPSSTTKPSPE